MRRTVALFGSILALSIWYYALSVAEPKYLGSDICAKCHGNITESWKRTKHFTAYGTLEKIKREKDDRCVGCHTTGFGHAAGFVDPQKTPGLKGVQCESCHGPGGDHVVYNMRDGTYFVDPEKISSSLSLEVCARCHVGEQEFRRSAHAGSLEDLRAKPYAGDECLNCHSADRILRGTKMVVTLKNAQYPITCAVCHNPHGTPFESQLRLGKQGTCARCHTMGDVKVEEIPHHPQSQMHLGAGGIGVPQMTSEFLAAGVVCSDCHIFAREYREGRPRISGHLFKTEPEACVNCHGGSSRIPPKLNTVDDARRSVEERQKSVAVLLDALKPKIEEGERILKEKEDLPKEVVSLFNEARFNYDFVIADRSKGFHNAPYARALLAVSSKKMEEFLKRAQ
ncbi:MAG: ammonia-forming cytochrome c nitrite reductase subunit c552 [bacterium]